MKQLLGICLLGILLVWMVPVGATAGDRQGRPASDSTVLKNPVPGISKFTCSGGDDDNSCRCSGLTDCMSLKNSGKCTGELVVGKYDEQASCPSNGAGQTAGGGNAKLKTGVASASTARSSGNPASGIMDEFRNPKKPGSDEYSCSYDPKTGKKIGCDCIGLTDCFAMADAGVCKNGLDTSDGNFGHCKK